MRRRPVIRRPWPSATLVVAVGLVRLAHAGPIDSPLPTFADGKPGRLVAVNSAIKNNEIETAVVCTNLADVPADVGVEFFDETGAARNTVAAGDGGLLGVAPGVTVTVASGATAVLHEDAVVTFNAAGNALSRLRHGSLRVVASDPRIGCAAFSVDRLHDIQDPTICPKCPTPHIVAIPFANTCSADACDDGNPCTADGCNGAGSCTHTAQSDGATCDDGNPCTTGDACTSGVCLGTAVVCGGDTPCALAATCDPVTGQCVDTEAFSTCVPGGGDATTDCALEWVVDNRANPTGVTSATQICRQGDPSCDFDIDRKRCTFRVRACLGAHDVTLPSCTPSAVEGLLLAKPRPSARTSPLLDAIAELAPSSRSGKGGKRIAFVPPDATTDDCTPPIGVEVRLGKALTLKTSTIAAGATDTDRLRLKCVRKLPPGH